MSEPQVVSLGRSSANPPANDGFGDGSNPLYRIGSNSSVTPRPVVTGILSSAASSIIHRGSTSSTTGVHFVPTNNNNQNSPSQAAANTSVHTVAGSTSDKKASIKDLHALLETVTAAYRLAVAEEEANALAVPPALCFMGVDHSNPNPSNAKPNTCDANGEGIGRQAVRSPQDSPRTEKSVSGASGSINLSRSAAAAAAAAPNNGPFGASLPVVGGHQQRQKLAAALQAMLDGVVSDLPSSSNPTVPNYKRIAGESTKALELLLKMLKADLAIAKQLHWVPIETVEPKVRQLRLLLEETSKKFGLQLHNQVPLFSPTSGGLLGGDAWGGEAAAVDVPTITVGSGTPNVNNDGSLFGITVTPSPAQQHQQPLAQPARNGSIGVRRISGSGSGTAPDGAASFVVGKRASRDGSATNNNTNSAILPSAGVDPSEVYDARVLFGNGGWRETEPEDQNALLRGTISRLTQEKSALRSELEAVERQMQHLRERLSRESDRALRAQQQMEVDIRHLTEQLGLTGGAAGGGEDGLAIAAGSTTSFEVRRAGKASSSSAGDHPLAGPNATSHDATPSKQLLTLGGIGGNNALSALSPPASPSSGGGANISNRYQKLEALYFHLYEGRGMEMIWNVIDTVYRCEFEAPATSGSPMRTLTTRGSGAAAHSTSASSPTSESAAASPERPAAPTTQGDSNPSEQQPSSAIVAQNVGGLSDPYKSFHDLFHAFIIQPLSTETAFNNAIRNVTPLRSDYVANCLQMRVKANSGIVKLLSLETSDGRVVELNLDGNYIGDHGLQPLLPLLARMHNLVNVRLAHNGLRNDGVAALCKTISNHPSIASIDLSFNAISRTGGKQLLSMVGMTPRVTFVGLEGTAMDAALRGRIEAAALVNLNALKQQQQQTH